MHVQKQQLNGNNGGIYIDANVEAAKDIKYNEIEAEKDAKTLNSDKFNQVEWSNNNYNDDENSENMEDDDNSIIVKMILVLKHMLKQQRFKDFKCWCRCG